MKDIDAKTKKKKLASLMKTMSSLAKKTKDDNIIQILGQKPMDDTERIPTGYLTLDVATGGGIKRGRVVELFGAESSGKSLIAQKIIAACQEHGGLCAYVDMEQTFDVTFAKKLGVITDDLVISQPASLQQAFEVIDALVDAGVDVIVLDSVAALVPEEELEANVGKQTIGLVARYMSQFLKRINVKLAKSGGILLAINQTRQKIGVLYGCMHGDTNIVFSDGTLHSIKDIVNNKLVGPVLSYDVNNHQFKSEKIVKWFNNGKLQDGQNWMKITTNAMKFQYNSFTCTNNHMLLDENEKYRQADTFNVGDKLISQIPVKIKNNKIYKEIIFGSLLGDGGIQIRNKNTATFLLQNNEQEEYINWKLDKLKELKFKNKSKNNNKKSYYSKYTNELKEIYDYFYVKRIDGKHSRMIPDGIKLTPLMMAIWFMDDGFIHHAQGGISIRRILNLKEEDKKHQINNLKSIVSEFIGCDINDLNYVEKRKKLIIPHEQFDVFCSKIAQFIIPSMQYKLLPKYQNKYVDFDSGKLDVTTYEKRIVTITDIEKNPPRKMRNKIKYDIEVENQHCYLVGGTNGVIVHNSNETTNGGSALKFYSSIRMRVSKSADGMIKEKGSDEPVGQGIRVKVVKNKTAPPFRTAEFKVYFDGRKISETDQIADIALTHSLIPRYNAAGERCETGRQYKWDSEPNFLAKSKAEVPEQLDKFPKVREELKKIIMSGDIDSYTTDSENMDSDMNDEDFEAQIREDADNIHELNEAEEEETSFDDV